MVLDFLKLIDVKESYQAPIKLEKIMLDSEQRTKLFDSFLAEQSDLSFDWFTEFFQTEQADRKDKKQDYTTDGIATVASELLGSTTSNADICAGTGGLTIKRWRDNPDARYYCEEFSDRAIPFLLFNLAIRNIDGIVWHGDSLTREEFATYKLSKGSQYSSIEKVNEKGLLDNNIKTDTVIMNPPYSMPWNPKPEYLQQPRFSEYEVLAPKSKSDYAFLLEGLYHLADNGTMSIILPHGILFRGQAEAKIRKQLIENNYIDAVIGLPDK
ncbi:HsdM family class I SAM-dependent methyltransferase, partial [Convivina praedatoris]|uniref:HsdM family class I SAM-dependent methyltransferase n=1 Tax=Convivina praedatoris TaxID=2880963 RepID=UPI00200F90DC